ncbi:Flp family type IVb pilin, partial [Acidiphilium sp.]|uniref:Flp family type IVb pilin n=2 Tax=Acidiphilium sp. TaxID=527 RepID=UPI00258E5578
IIIAAQAVAMRRTGDLTMLDYAKTWLALRGLTFAKDNRGVTAMEYGLIAALMAVVIVAAFGVFGSGLKNVMNTLNTDLNGQK